VRLVRAFNAINYKDLASQAHRAGEPAAIPLAGDDQEASPRPNGSCETQASSPWWSGRSRVRGSSNVGTAVYTQLLTAPQLRESWG